MAAREADVAVDDAAVPARTHVQPRFVPETFALARVGTLRSAFRSAFGCPRQGLAAPSARGRIDLEAWMRGPGGSLEGARCLEGLEGFSHIWVIFLFDQNRHSSTSFDPVGSFLRPTVRPPWLASADGKRGSRGVFATRSPHRPNPLGLTVCKLDRVDHRSATVYISGIDVVDGSAVLDIKPYHPVDSVPVSGPVTLEPGTAGADAAAPPRSSTRASAQGAACFPSWLPAPGPCAEVRWRGPALEQLEALLPHCEFYPDPRDAAAAVEERGQLALRALRSAVEEVIGLDPRTPQSRGRGAGGSPETTHRYWALDFDATSVAFRLAEGGSEARPLFEVVSVERRGRSEGRTSKAWLEALRAELESVAGV